MIPFQVRLPDAINRDVKSIAAQLGVTKHEFIYTAIKNELGRRKRNLDKTA